MLGGDYSIKFVLWFVLGCVLLCYVVSEIWCYESVCVENKSMYWVIFELIWRDFFKFFALKYGNKIFYFDGMVNRMVFWKSDEKILKVWKIGMIGYLFIDVNMCEFVVIGFMSNRGR